MGARFKPLLQWDQPDSDEVAHAITAAHHYVVLDMLMPMGDDDPRSPLHA